MKPGEKIILMIWVTLGACFGATPIAREALLMVMAVVLALKVTEASFAFELVRAKVRRRTKPVGRRISETESKHV
jgi:hypothetical protein